MTLIFRVQKKLNRNRWNRNRQGDGNKDSGPKQELSSQCRKYKWRGGGTLDGTHSQEENHVHGREPTGQVTGQCKGLLGAYNISCKGLGNARGQTGNPRKQAFSHIHTISYCMAHFTALKMKVEGRRGHI
jgi:hypothetical protein